MPSPSSAERALERYVAPPLYAKNSVNCACLFISVGSEEFVSSALIFSSSSSAAITSAKASRTSSNAVRSSVTASVCCFIYETSSPFSAKTVPSSAVSSPERSRNSVVLPAPFTPTIPTLSFASTLNVTSSIITSVP